MKLKNVEVTSKGTTVGTVDIEEFEQIQEAVDFFQQEENAAAEAAKREAKPDAGDKAVLALINAQHRANVTNRERTKATRPTNAFTALRGLVGENAEAKSQLEALLAQYNIAAKLD